MAIEIKGDIIPNDYQWVYDWLGWDGVSPKAVNQALAEANGQPVDVNINSGGGDVMAGSEIYTALRSYKGDVNIHIVGFACSAASFIAMAGHCDMSPVAQMMVHRVSSYAEGNKNDMGHMAEVLENADKAIAAAYVEKSGMSEKDALAMMDKETWLTAQQAVDKHLVDGIMFRDESGIQLAASASHMIPREKMDLLKKALEAKSESAELQKAQLKQNMLKLKGVHIDE